jgi:hypothetical protein
LRAKPEASDKELFDDFCAGLCADQSHLGDIIAYWFNNHRRKLEVLSPSPQSVAIVSAGAIRRRARTSRVAARAAVEKTKAMLRRNIVLFNLQLPNGKSLREASFHDCKEAGGWYAEIYKARRNSPATALVTASLTEADLHSLYERVSL